MTPLRVLYVDDDADVRLLVGLSLDRDPDMSATLAASGAEALALIRTGGAPSVAIIDLSMPDMDGFALFDALRLLPGHAALPIIFMTAIGRPRQADLLRGRDACGVIAKPFDPLMLPANIRALLNRRPQY